MILSPCTVNIIPTQFLLLTGILIFDIELLRDGLNDLLGNRA